MSALLEQRVSSLEERVSAVEDRQRLLDRELANLLAGQRETRGAVADGRQEARDRFGELVRIQNQIVEHMQKFDTKLDSLITEGEDHA